MKIRTTSIAAALLFSFAVGAQAQAWLTNGLVAHYPFIGNANDITGHGFDGTPNQTSFTSDRNGLINGACSFNGANSYISFALPPLIQVDNWTISTWIKPGSLNQYGYAVCMGYEDGWSADGYALGVMAGPVTTGSNLFGVFGDIAWNNSGFKFDSTNQWYHVVMLRETGAAKFYVNGTSITNLVNIPPKPPSAFRIGSAFGVRFFTGAIDDVRLYNRALSASEVSQLFATENHCSPHNAKATAQVINGFVVGATITDTGCGYTNPPLVLVQGGSGAGATATAVVSNGLVVAINVTSPGCCYSNAPTIHIASPPFVPTVEIHISRVNVVQHVVLGRNYSLESSGDMVSWAPTGPPFTALSEEIISEFEVSDTQRFFRLREVP